MPYNRHEVNVKSTRKKKKNRSPEQWMFADIITDNVSFNFLNDSDNYNKAWKFKFVKLS